MTNINQKTKNDPSSLVHLQKQRVYSEGKASLIVRTLISYTKLTLSIGESPSKYPFLKNNGSEAPKVPRIHYFSGMDTYSDFLRLKLIMILYKYIMCVNR